MSSPIKHLLIPKEFKVYCRPSHSASELAVTNTPSKASCVNCLTVYRAKKGIRRPFKVSYTPATREKKEHEDNSKRCAVCGGRIYLESAAEGYSCKSCGSSDSDE